MHAAIDDVHHRHRQQPRRRAADIAIERQARAPPPPPWRPPSDTPRIALAPSRLLFGVPSSAISVSSILTCCFGVHAADRVEDLAVDGGDRLAHALAEIALLVAVAQLDRLVRAGRGARRHGRAAEASRPPARHRPRRSDCRGCRGFRGRRYRQWRSWRSPCSLARVIHGAHHNVNANRVTWHDGQRPSPFPHISATQPSGDAINRRQFLVSSAVGTLAAPALMRRGARRKQRGFRVKYFPVPEAVRSRDVTAASDGNTMWFCCQGNESSAGSIRATAPTRWSISDRARPRMA